MKKNSNERIETATLILQAILFLAEIVLLISIVINRENSLETVILFLAGATITIPFIGCMALREPNFRIRKIVVAIGVCICIAAFIAYGKCYVTQTGTSMAFAVALSGLIVLQFSFAPEKK